MKEALLIIDLQNDYYPQGKMPLEGIELASSNATKTLKHFRENNKPIIHIQHIMALENAPFFVPNSEGVAIQTDLAPHQGEAHFIKHYPSAFQDTLLEKYLHEHKIDSLVIVGAMSHMCIDTTVRSSFERGFTCKVLHDACATRSLEFEGEVISAKAVHGSIMAALDGTFAKVLSTKLFLEG